MYIYIFFFFVTNFGVMGRVLEPVPAAFGLRQVTLMNVTQLGPCVAQGYLSVVACPPAIRTPFRPQWGLNQEPSNSVQLHYRLIYPII